MAQKGFITYAIDWIGMGEQNDTKWPNYRKALLKWQGNDWCDPLNISALAMGMTSLSISLSNGKAATDFICTLPNVDKNNLGVMGLSTGGTMTLWTMLNDPRFKAGEIICYSDLFATFTYSDQDNCGAQYTPGLFKLVDVPDLQGLIAPKPLLVDIGANDDIFHIDGSMTCYEKVKNIYNIAGVPDKLEIDLTKGRHGWGANKSEAFFEKYLGVLASGTAIAQDKEIGPLSAYSSDPAKVVRSQSPTEMLLKLALEIKPQFSCKAKTKNEFDKWKSEAYPKVMGTLGDLPQAVPANPTLVGEWEHDGVIEQRWMIDVSKYISASLLINFPKGLKPGEKRPAIFCWHGHCPDGKAPIMGNYAAKTDEDIIESRNYIYGLKMAQEGFITYAIDWMGMGERNECEWPNYRVPPFSEFGSDWCNILFLEATMLDMTPLGMNLYHGKVATDFVCSLPNVDSSKLGVMGLNTGGTMTLWTMLYDKRFKAGEIICYSDIFASFGYRDIYMCGSQTTPDLYKLVDVPDLQGLIAPKPLLVDIGANDDNSRVEGAMTCYQKVRKIYNVAGVPDKLYADIHPNKDAWGGHKSVDFFEKYLK